MPSKVHRPLIVLLLALAPAAALAKGPQAGDLRKVGKVHLPISCAERVRPEFDRGLALLHSFFYDEARRIFTSVAKQDPKCAMAYWGIAMTLWHPIWAPPSEQEAAEGLAAMKKAMELGGQTELEKLYIAALNVYYTEPKDAKVEASAATCHSAPTLGTHRARAVAYAKFMEDAYAHHPQDTDIGSFYALGLLGSADPTDKTLSQQKKAAEILEKFYAQKDGKQHPGLVHYLIHAYDYPSTAEKGLGAANNYAAIAPWVSHALHMPSHIFVRLGMWKETIDSNLAAADADAKQCAKNHPGATCFDELHADDYLVYAYLQTGQDAKAKALVDAVAKVKNIYPEVDFASAYAVGAIPVRYALERRAWAEAAALPIPEGRRFEAFPFAQAHSLFARGLGNARLGKVAEAKAEGEKLKAIVGRMTDPRFAFFAKQTGTQLAAVNAWTLYAEGKKDQAEKLLREAADQDDALGKHPVSPGSMLPLRELLADMLLDMGKTDLALAEYEACAKLNPYRLNTLYGAGIAAQRANKKDVAKKYFGELIKFAVPDKKAPRKEIAEARSFITIK